MLSLSASVRAQVRVEAIVPPAAPGGIAILPVGSAPAPLSLSAPVVGAALTPSLSLIAPALTAVPVAAPVAAAAPAAAFAAPADGPEAARAPEVVASEAPAAEATEPAKASAYERWSLPKSAEGAAWRFRDLPFFGSRLWDGARKIQELGAGAMGTVFAHPTRHASVVKVARAGYADSTGDFMSTDEEALDFEDHALAQLAAHDAAPKPLARLTVSGRPASERERIFGDTVARMKLDGRFGRQERGMVQYLLERVAAGGYVARDLNLGNIMIGTREGDWRRSAWIVDTLGVEERPELDDAGRVAEMLDSPVPWIAYQGLGLHRPLSRALDGAMNPEEGLFATTRTPLAWPKALRWTTLAALLGLMTVAPPVAHALVPAAPSALGLIPSWTTLIGLSAALGLAGIPLRLFAHRLAPWIMTRSKDEGADMLRDHPASAVPTLAIGAAVEEAFFRGLIFLGGALLLAKFLPWIAAFAVAAFASSFVFALIHGYGSVWTRVVGGLLYAGALVATGSLVLPIATHFAFNLSLYVYGRYLK